MIVCPSCGANLKYDIAQKRMLCEFCGSSFDPQESFVNTNETEQELFDVTVFTCPQCGGEMYSESSDATAFCSFCGASNILNSRLEGVKKPAKIVPFIKTRQDCIKAYGKAAKRAFFAPSLFRDEKHLENFRPMYIPYWLYSMRYKGPFTTTGKIEKRKGDYVYTDYSDLTCDVDANFTDLPFDACSSFDDTLAKEVAPFNTKDTRDFAPGYLSGFYANIADVDADVYRMDAKGVAAGEISRQITGVSEFDKYDYEVGNQSALPLKDISVRSAMFPVWFLSFRRENRVAYAVVNGQTGKVHCDLPVSYGRFFTFSAALAVPLFFLLNMFFTFLPSTALTISVVLGAVAMALCTAEKEAIREKDERTMDKGYRSLQKSSDKKNDAKKPKKSRPKSTPGGKGRKKVWIGGVLEYVGIAVFIAYFFPDAVALLGNRRAILAIVCLAAGIIYTAVVLKDFRRIGIPSFLLVGAGAAACAILCIAPVSDLWYYGGEILVLLMICVSLTELIRRYNDLVTRPLPQFSSAAGKAATLLALILIPALFLRPVSSFAAEQGRSVWENPQTGFMALVEDREDLLSTEEEQALLSQLKESTEYGHAGVLTTSSAGGSIDVVSESLYHGRFGRESGTLFIIDMGLRKVALYSDGANYRVITKTYANVISDNVYTFASRGEFFACASAAFTQVNALLAGRRIAQPMKYISNALLALILAVLFNYGILRAMNASRAPKDTAVLGQIAYTAAAVAPAVIYRKTVKRYDPVERGGGGGFGGGSSGGGSSGGGGSHSF